MSLENRFFFSHCDHPHRKGAYAQNAEDFFGLNSSKIEFSKTNFLIFFPTLVFPPYPTCNVSCHVSDGEVHHDAPICSIFIYTLLGALPGVTEFGTAQEQVQNLKTAADGGIRLRYSKADPRIPQ